MVLAQGVLTSVQLNIYSLALQLGCNDKGCNCKRPLADFKRSERQSAVDSIKTVIMTRVLVCWLGDLGVEWWPECVPRESLGETSRFGLGRGHLKCCHNLRHMWYVAECWLSLEACIHAWVFCLFWGFYTNFCLQLWWFQSCLNAPVCCCLEGDGTGLQSADQVPLLLPLPSQCWRLSLNPSGNLGHISIPQRIC